MNFASAYLRSDTKNSEVSSSMWLLFLLVSTLSFNFILCFINANLIAVTNLHVIGCELAILMLAFLTARSVISVREISFIFLLTFYLLCLALIRSLSGSNSLDVKIIRDFLIPVAFFCLGKTIPLRQADRIIGCMLVIVLVVGLFENFFLDLYLKYLNVIGYYISRGTTPDIESVRQASGGLMVSGIRPESQGRQLLPWLLSGHRISSVFLEPTSLGNFGIIVTLWATVRSRVDRQIWWRLAAGGLACIILSDTRFAAFFLIVGVGIIVLLPVVWSTIVVWFMPLAAVLFLMVIVSPADLMSNDTGGRLAYASLVLQEFGFVNWIGLADSTLQTYDAGYGYLISGVGIMGALALWAVFMSLSGKTSYFYEMRNAVGAYLAILFLISQSQMTIKTAAVLWMMLGTLSVTKAKPINSPICDVV